MTIVASPNPPSATANQFQLVWQDEAACADTAQRLAQWLAAYLENGGAFVMELHGTLGAGKTTFTRHLLRTMGVQGRIKSPSYAVVEPHELPGHTVHHFDFYRFNDPQEWEDAGFRDVFAAPGLKLIEWADNARALLPEPDLQLHLNVRDDDQRDVTLRAHGQMGLAALHVLRTPVAGDTPHA